MPMQLVTSIGLQKVLGVLSSALQHPAAHLVEFDALEQRLEVAVAEAVVALALDELEKDRAQLVLAEDLQQDRVLLAVDQDLALVQFFHAFAVAGNALVHQLVVGVDRVQQAHAGAAQRVHRGVEVVRAHGDVLDALAVVHVQVLLDLAGLFLALFVDRNADLAAGAGHGLALDARDLAFDVEVADLAEVEQALVEVRPFDHPAAVHVVRQVVDVGQAVALGVERLLGGHARQRLEIDVEEADVADVARLRAVLAAPAVHQIDQAVADALDGGNVQLARAGLAGVAPGAQGQRALVGGLGVVHAEGDGADAGPVQPREALREAVGLGVDDEVDFALAIERHVLVAVARHWLEAHALEHPAHGLRIGGGVFDEFEAVGTHRVLPGGGVLDGGVGQWGVHALSPGLAR